MIMNIIFFATMYPIVFIILFLFSTQNKYENGRLFAVNMKKEWIKDATVADIRQKFKKEMRYYTILLAIVPFVSLLTSHMSIQLTIWMFWLLAAAVPQKGGPHKPEQIHPPAHNIFFDIRPDSSD